MHYSISSDEQGWLVCSYGSTRRIKGTMLEGHEWNQAMEPTALQWWVKLAPKIGACTVRVREHKARSARNSKWTVQSACEGAS